MLHILPAYLYFFLCCSFVVGQFDSNFTLQNVWGRLPSETSRSLIQCVSSNGQPGKIKFGRSIDVGEGLKLPKFTQQFLQGAPVHARILFMPGGDELSRFGAFHCEVTNGGVKTKITTLKLPPENIAEFEPEEPYIVANQGDDVYFAMKKVITKNLPLRWRHNGGNIIEKWNDQLNVSIPSVTVTDAGIYECYYEGRRNEHVHGILRLIVRGCPSGKYGQLCDQDCPPCYNGGICHDRWGVCVCPPGFTGSHCEKACGGNLFGAECSKICTSGQHVDRGCAIHLFCKPDPYGCSCAPGYKGPICATECKPGWYGADCKQPCHCANGSKACNRITGQCNGSCSNGWIGESCQIRDPSVPFLPNITSINCPVGKFGVICDQECHCRDNEACDSLSGTCPGECENGWGGSSCDECVEGRFGDHCDNTCHCEGGHINCDKNGFCVRGCMAGWTGFTCQQECNLGRFGPNCAYSCHCNNGAKFCDTVTGNCKGDCEAGYKGKNCQTLCPSTSYGINCSKNCTCENGGHCNRMNGSCTCEGRWRGKICTENIPQIVAASDEEVNTGQSKYISCTADAIPPPSVQINSSQLSSINSKVQELDKNQYQAVVKVTVSKAGYVDFLCIASNDYGFVEKSFTLHVIDPPVLRSKPKVLDVNATSVAVSWPPWEFGKDDGGIKSDRVDYIVVYHKKTETQLHKLDSWQPGLTATVSNLMPDTEYEVAVRCRRQGRGGDGKPSPSISVRTLCGKPNPNGIPQDFHAVVINTTSTQLLWNPPLLSDLQCHLLAYRLRFWKTLDKLSVQQVEINSSEESFIITNLTAYSNYTLQMYPLTSSGLGSYSASLNITTPESVPGPVQNLSYHHLPDPYSLLVTWNVPREIHGKLKNYLINYNFIGVRDCGTFIDDTHSNNLTTLTTQNKQITILGLRSFSNYYITVHASTAAGFGNVKELYAVTKETAPSGVPQNIRVMTVDKNVLEFHWDSIPCDQSNGKIINYEYALHHIPHFRSNKTRKKRSMIRISKTNETTAHLTELVPFETYTFAVRGYTKVGAGPFSKKIFQKTADDVPPAPSVILIEKSNQHITLRIKPPNPTHGVILQYNLSYSTADNQSYHSRFVLINSIDQNDNGTDVSKIYQLQNLLPYTKYLIKAQASTRVGWGYWSETATILTEESLPGPPTQIKLVSKTNSSLKISWAPPDKPNGMIIMYQVKCQPITTADPQYQLKKLILHSTKVNDTRRSYEITDLHHSTAYQFQVRAFTQAGYGQEAEAVYWTEFAEIDAPPKVIILNDYVTENSVPIIFTPTDHIGVKKYQIIVEKADNKAGVDERKLQDYKGSMENNISYYITAELDASEVSKHRRFYFVVGDEKLYGRFMNMALKAGERYNIRIRTISQFDMEEKSRSAISFPQSSIKVGGSEIQKNERNILGMPWLYFMFIMLGVFVFLAVAILFLGLFFSRHKKSVQCKKITNGFAQPEISDAMTWSVAYKVPECQATDSPLVESSQPIILSKSCGSLTKHGKRKLVHSSTSVPVGKLPDYIFKKKTNVTSTFSDEFNSLLAGQTSQWSEAKKTENIKKNQYGNLLPYDHCRVILEPLQGVTSSDYINASYIGGYNSTKEYIVSQGPKENTSLDFWRMVWQENASIIVMVTGLIENGKRKCAKYWPDDSIQYGDLQVLLIHKEMCMNFIIRTILLRKNRETRRVHHYQVLDWPANGIPSNTASLIMLQHRIRTDNPNNKSPIIVHCSAGIGRSGTFIAIDALRHQANEESQVDVFSFVNKMRMQRINMVPTLKQYTFIYEALSEAVLCGDTMVMADQLHMYVQRICSQQPNTDMSEIKQQFETLSKIQQKISISQFSDALNDINISKNRDPMIVPSNKSRIRLLTPVAESRSDYVNAVAVDGYKRKSAFLVTQMPLKHTVVDFWRLIYDMQSPMIIMLNDHNQSENPLDVGQYWPNEDCSTFGPFEVQIMKYEDQGTVVVRKMKLINNNQPSKEPLKIIQLQYMDWDQEEVLPANATSVLALLNHVERWYRKTDGGPITVHCMNGASRCGLFCAISSICDQIKREQLVDVFQVVRWIQNNRPEFISCMEQYKFCYEVALEFVDSFSVYGKFQPSS